MPTARKLAQLYRQAHNIMRNIDGLQPQEAFDELLKYLFFRQKNDAAQRETITTNSVTDIRKLFSQYLGRTNSWSAEIWRDKKIHLSDKCLSDIHELLQPVEISKLDLDIRSHALREFLSSDLRKGLGIFLTPEDVVKAIVEYVAPRPGQSVLDPACGSGTFLIEVAKHCGHTKQFVLHGSEKSPRMLLLADLNLGDDKSVSFRKSLGDSLKQYPFKERFDLIFTNPPFGVSLDSRDYDTNEYKTFRDEAGYQIKKQSSEIVFIERCLQLLNPGGTLAIVIPRSIATNNRLKHARSALGSLGYIHSIISLPPETFSTAGTQTTTIVLFVKKYRSPQEASEPTKLVLGNVRNVGFDSTGRPRKGSELPSLSSRMLEAASTGKGTSGVQVQKFKEKGRTFEELESIFVGAASKRSGVPLAEICEYIGTGKTPPRANYSSSGTFLIKVGNLTGSGLSWDARDRNFVDKNELEKRVRAKKPLILQEGDILLTSSAHNSSYIAKKCDIFCGVPSFVPSEAVSFVGEVMLIRPKKGVVSPFALLAFLREKSTVESIQQMVRGQTAHLHAADIGLLPIPDEVFKSEGKYSEVADLLKKQAKLSEELNKLLMRQDSILNKNIEPSLT